MLDAGMANLITFIYSDSKEDESAVPRRIRKAETGN